MNTALLGMLLFIASEVMFFAGLFAAYFNVRASTLPVWPPPEGAEFIVTPVHPSSATIILVISSFTMQWGVMPHPQGRPHGHEPGPRA